MPIAVRLATGGDADLATVAAIVNDVSPDEPTSIEEMRWSDRTYPGGARYLAEEDGRAVGVATVGRIYMHPPEFPALWATIDVLPQDRRQGVGGTLLTAVSARARDARKPELMVRAGEACPEGIEFLRRRGFREYERSKAVRLRLQDLAPPAIHLPAGLELTSLADRPDLVVGVHAVARETVTDIPGGDEPMTVGDLAEFRARDIDRPAIPHDAFMVATEASTGRVIGYASLLLAGGESRRMAWHDMTAVARAWRGRGVASALKRATIRWAIEHGVAVLQTGNDTNNAPMRAVNDRLGYEPMPDLVTMRGPLFDGIMGRS